MLLFILMLGMAIVIHELGHFLLARLFGVRVFVFSIFFSPGFSLLEYDGVTGCLRLIVRRTVRQIDDGENVRRVEYSNPLLSINLGRSHPDCPEGSWRRTRFVLGWLPCGGFCRIADQYVAPDVTPLPWTLAAKSPAKRIAVNIAGVVFNFVSAIIALVAVYFFWPTESLPAETFAKGFTYKQDASNAGFVDGDIPVAVAGQQLDWLTNYNALFQYAAERQCDVTVLRGEKRVNITLPADPRKRLDAIKGIAMATPRGIRPTIADDPDLPDGINPGDMVFAVDGVKVDSHKHLDSLLTASPEAIITLCDTAGEFYRFPLVEGYKLPTEEAISTEAVRHHHDPAYALDKGVSRGLSTVSIIARHPVMLVSSDPAMLLIYSEHFSMGQRFLFSFGILSVFLAVLNILPIPGLDGSRIWLPLYELITRRRASEKLRRNIDKVGSYVILAFFVWFIVSIFI